MADIRQYMHELREITSELKSINVKAKELRDRKKLLDEKILKYLEETEQPGVKYQDLIVIKKESTTHIRKKKTEQKDSITKLLEDHGISDSQSLYDSILDAMKGEEEIKTKLRYKSAIPELF